MKLRLALITLTSHTQGHSFPFRLCPPGLWHCPPGDSVKLMVISLLCNCLVYILCFIFIIFQRLCFQFFKNTTHPSVARPVAFKHTFPKALTWLCNSVFPTLSTNEHTLAGWTVLSNFNTGRVHHTGGSHLLEMRVQRLLWLGWPGSSIWSTQRTATCCSLTCENKMCIN